MRVKNKILHFEPRIPAQWNEYSFKVNFKNQILKVNVSKNKTHFELEGTEPLKISVNNKLIAITPSDLVSV